MAGTTEGKTRPLLSLCSPGRGFLMERGNEKTTRATRNTKCAVWLRMSCQGPPSKELLLRLGLEGEAAARQEQQPQARKPCREEHPYTAD